MPAISCWRRSAGRASRSSNRPACWSSARAVWAHRSCNTSLQPRVGTIGIVDDDTVALSNLQRQIIHPTAHVGMAKTGSAAAAIAALNPHVKVEQHCERLEEANGERLVAGYDIVADGSDNFATRYLAASLCEKLEKTLVTAAVGRFDGNLTTLKPHETGSDGAPLPRYRDIFPEQPPEGLLPSCAEAGIIGALTGVIGAMQALEVIKEITGAGESLAGRLILFDALSMRFETIRYRRGRQP